MLPEIPLHSFGSFLPLGLSGFLPESPGPHVLSTVKACLINNNERQKSRKRIAQSFANGCCCNCLFCCVFLFFPRPSGDRRGSERLRGRRDHGCESLLGPKASSLVLAYAGSNRCYTRRDYHPCTLARNKISRDCAAADWACRLRPCVRNHKVC
jgi:hypothetical protein